MEPIENMSNIDIDDVAITERLPCAGDAMTDDLIDGGTDALGKSLVVEGGRDCPSTDCVLVHEGVDILRSDTGAQHFSDQGEGFGRHTADTAHGLDFLLGFYLD